MTATTTASSTSVNPLPLCNAMIRSIFCYPHFYYVELSLLLVYDRIVECSRSSRLFEHPSGCPGAILVFQVIQLRASDSPNLCQNRAPSNQDDHLCVRRGWRSQ